MKISYLIITLLVLPLFLWLIVYLFQDKLIFRPTPLSQGYSFQFEHDFEEYELKTTDGELINALFFPSYEASKKVVLYLHGNRHHLQRWAKHHNTFNQLGYDFFALDYRGFGKSTGTPSEAGLYKDVEAAWQWLKERYPPENIVIYGRSLGTGPATYLAYKYPAAKLLLETPYNNMPCVVRSQAIIPIPGFLFKIHLPIDDWLPDLQTPIYIFAGNRDKVIPPACTKKLKPLLAKEGYYYEIEGAGHRNLADFEEYHYYLKKALFH